MKRKKKRKGWEDMCYGKSSFLYTYSWSIKNHKKKMLLLTLKQLYQTKTKKKILKNIKQNKNKINVVWHGRSTLLYYID